MLSSGISIPLSLTTLNTHARTHNLWTRLCFKNEEMHGLQTDG